MGPLSRSCCSPTHSQMSLSLESQIILTYTQLKYLLTLLGFLVSPSLSKQRTRKKNIIFKPLPPPVLHRAWYFSLSSCSSQSSLFIYKTLTRPFPSHPPPSQGTQQELILSCIFGVCGGNPLISGSCSPSSPREDTRPSLSSLNCPILPNLNFLPQTTTPSPGAVLQLTSS